MVLVQERLEICHSNLESHVTGVLMLHHTICCPDKDLIAQIWWAFCIPVTCLFICIHKRHRIIHIPIIPLFKNCIAILSFSTFLSILIVFPATTHLSPILTSPKKAMFYPSLSFALLCYGISPKKVMWTSELPCIKHSKLIN